jgi:hypothetical protein
MRAPWPQDARGGSTLARPACSLAQGSGQGLCTQANEASPPFTTPAPYASQVDGAAYRASSLASASTIVSRRAAERAGRHCHASHSHHHSAQHTGTASAFVDWGSTAHKGSGLGRQAHPCVATMTVRRAAKRGRQRDMALSHRQHGLMLGRAPGRSGTSARWPARAPPS